MSGGFEDMFDGMRLHDGKAPKARKPGSTPRTQSAGPKTALDKTSTAAWEILDEDARARAEKTARLKAARQARDGDKTD
ncbi:hypothetical protein [Tropicibacter alexandrii]|jgi:hypothetical protein|uniref:hypothetical protein n=1 Tax=Tropicibacter alexandrii TaxID=2267683 RepID=UPI000EF558DE|nr:hypothetical protein [Tropicibacter alexandrii]